MRESSDSCRVDGIWLWLNSISAENEEDFADRRPLSTAAVNSSMYKGLPSDRSTSFRTKSSCNGVEDAYVWINCTLSVRVNRSSITSSASFQGGGNSGLNVQITKTECALIWSNNISKNSAVVGSIQ